MCKCRGRQDAESDGARQHHRVQDRRSLDPDRAREFHTASFKITLKTVNAVFIYAADTTIEMEKKRLKVTHCL